MQKILEGVRLTISRPQNFSQNDTGLATIPNDLKTGELYYTEDGNSGNSDTIIPRLFTKNSQGDIVCLTPHVFSGATVPTLGYRDGDIWIKTAE